MKLINERQIGVMIMKFTNLTAKEFGAFVQIACHTVISRKLLATMS